MRRPQLFRRLLVPFGSCLLWPLACNDKDLPAAVVCNALSSECPAVIPSYADEVAPILAARCGQCHTRGNPDPMAPWPLDNPEDLADWSTPLEADLAECLMPPPGAEPLTDAERETLHVWLTCGAPH